MEYNLKHNIKIECDKRGWSITRLAKESGIPQQTIHAWTTGRRPNLEQLRQVADTLKVPLYKLAFGCNDPHEIDSEFVLTQIFKEDVRLTIEKIERIKR